jgi:hypothetical protein
MYIGLRYRWGALLFGLDTAGCVEVNLFMVQVVLLYFGDWILLAV